MKYILAFVLCISSVTFAQTKTTEGTGSTKMNSSNTVNDSAGKGKSSQKSGGGANQMAGTAFMMLCMVGCTQAPPNMKYACYACPLAGMALSQALADNGAADESGKTYDASLNGGDYSVAGLDGGYTAEGYKDTSGTKTAATIKENLDKLKSYGYTVNPDGTVTTPDGKTVSSDTFSSAGGMAGAGYSPSEISAAQASIAKVNKQIADEYGGGKVVAVAVDSSGGGAGGGSGSSYEKDTSFDDYLKSLKRGGMSGAAAQRAVAGKVVVIDGQAYGVKGDNIFTMVAREYSERRDHQGFLAPLPEAKPKK